MIDLDERAVVAEAGAQGEMRLAPVGEVRRDQAVAMRLVGEVEEQLDIASIADAACHGEFRSRHRTTYDIRGARLYVPETLTG